MSPAVIPFIRYLIGWPGSGLETGKNATISDYY